MYEKMIQIDPNAPTEEEHIAKGVTKPRYMVRTTFCDSFKYNYHNSPSRFGVKQSPAQQISAFESRALKKTI